jgi:hypothetical protein
MTDRDIIIRLATEVMGWNIRAVALTSGIFDAPDGGTHCWPKWNPLESWDDVMEMQSAFGEKNPLEYARCLMAILDPTKTGLSNQLAWRCANATPRQRCEAMIAALDGGTA